MKGAFTKRVEKGEGRPKWKGERLLSNKEQTTSNKVNVSRGTLGDSSRARQENSIPPRKITFGDQACRSLGKTGQVLK